MNRMLNIVNSWRIKTIENNPMIVDVSFDWLINKVEKIKKIRNINVAIQIIGQKLKNPRINFLDVLTYLS